MPWPQSPRDTAGNLATSPVITVTVPPDTISPKVLMVTPVEDTVKATLGATMRVTFNEAMAPESIDDRTFEVHAATGKQIKGRVTYNEITNVATFVPTQPLTNSTRYTATLSGGRFGARVTDVAGNALTDDYLWSFTTTDCLFNPVVCENVKRGNPASEWDVSGAGDPSIQGFATDISVDQGETIHFKIDTDARDYRLDIYRMGYYDGMGARKVATVQPSASLPQRQPDCLSIEPGFIDCGNWAESASWAVPVEATSGIYFAKAIRTDTKGASHIVFVVRDDDGGSDLLFQTSDTTWQAYNRYGGDSLYTGGVRVSYNRPFDTREELALTYLFHAEYPMVRWLEANGYDVSYFTGVDSDRLGAEILEHRVFLSVGHDEYWSAVQRSQVEAARAAGVNLAFFQWQ